MRAQLQLGRQLAAGSVLLGCLAAGCGGSDDEAVRNLRVFDLIAAMPRATIQAPEPTYVGPRIATLQQQSVPVIFMHPASAAEFPAIRLGQDATFTADLALEEIVKEKPGDGVEFNVSVRLEDGSVTKVFSRYVDPRVNEQDRGLLPVRVPLGAFAGQNVRLILSTTAGPKEDGQFDWALWGQPRVFLDSK